MPEAHEVFLYVCNHCRTVRMLFERIDHGKHDVVCPVCNIYRKHWPVTIDFERQKFTVPLD